MVDWFYSFLQLYRNALFSSYLIRVTCVSTDCVIKEKIVAQKNFDDDICSTCMCHEQ